MLRIGVRAYYRNKGAKNGPDSGVAQVGTGNDLVISIPYDPIVPRRLYRLALD